MSELTIAPSMIPMRGTTRVVRITTRRRISMNSIAPTNAKPLAITILPTSPIPGSSSAASSSPSAAHSVVPEVVASTKRFWVSICITRPLVAIAAPASTSAIVRGTLVIQNISGPKSLPEMS